MFTDELGEPISPQTLSHHFKALARRSGVRGRRLHDGRHSAATMLLDGGTPVHIVSQMLGHSRASVTLDVYAHVIDGGGAEAGERLTAMLANRAQA